MDPKVAFFEIELVSLVGVGTYEKILRPTQNPTLAGMDPLPQDIRIVIESQKDVTILILDTRTDIDKEVAKIPLGKEIDN